MKQKLLSIFLALICTTSLFAYDCVIDGIYYNLNSTDLTAEVTNETGDWQAKSHSSSVVIPSTITYNSQTFSVTTIGGSAFEGCIGLTSVTIPNSVTSIGERAFGYCEGLTSVTIPNSVTTIGNNAFLWCKGLTSITIPNSVTTIGSCAFAGCDGLTSITIPNSVTTIGDWAFSRVNNIVYNGTATGSPWGAKCVNGYVDGYLVYSDATKTTLCGCSSAATGEIVIPNSVTTIGEYAFEYCSGLTSITIPNSVTTIGDDAFYNCSGLTSITIPNSVTTIGYMAFYGCSSLTSVTIPNSVSTIGEYAFEYCSGLTSVTIPNSVTTIGKYAFEYCSGLTSITIPNSVTTIGRGAFYRCSGLTSVTIPNSVTTIGDDAFYLVNNIVYNGTATGAPWGAKCVNGYMDGYLVYSDASKTILCGCSPAATGEIVIPNSVTTIGEYAFEYCSGLTSITIPNSVTTIGDDAFYNCSGLTSITIGNSVTTIGVQAFAWCSGLTSVTIGNSVTTIGNSAFYGCSGLTSVTIPNSVTTIGGYAFSDCSGLTSVTIPNSVTTIGDYAFEYCSGLTSINVDATNTHYCSIDGVLFNYAKDTLIQYPAANTRTEYTIPNSVTTIGGGAFYGCSGLTSVTIPNSVTTIGNYAFAYCYGLTSVTIPNSVTTIGYYAFSECFGLTSVTIGNSVTTIEGRAFCECTGLTSITCYTVTPPVCGNYVFNGISQDAKVYVPASALVDYQNAEVWKDLQLFPIAAEVTPMDGENPIVTPTNQDVTITWQITDGTDTYTLTITKNGEVVCVLTFNANGQLTNIAFAAPGHNGAHQAPAATLTAQGYQFTVTGLTPSTNYNYSVTATDAGGQTLAEHKGNFSTTGGESDLQNVRNGVKASKYFHNGNFIIERNGVKYTPAGQKVR